MSHYSDEKIAFEETCCQGFCAKESCCGSSVHCYQVKRRSNKAVFSLGILGTLCILIGIIGPVIINGLLDQGIDDSLVVDSKDASSYDSWSRNNAGTSDDVNIYYEVHMFDITNPDEAGQGEKPTVAERGPYVYREYFQKFDIEFFDHGNKVSFFTWKYYVFDPDLSYPHSNDEEDMVTNINLIALAAEYYLEDLLPDDTPSGPGGNSLKDLAMKMVLCSNPNNIEVTPFYSQSVKNWFWGYWDDPYLVGLRSLLESLNKSTSTFTTSVPGITNNMSDMDEARRRTNVDVTHTGKSDVRKVGKYIYYQNMSSEHVCLEATSKGQPWNESAQQWPACVHYQSEWTEAEAEANGWVPTWATDYANSISGSDCTFFPREVSQKEIGCFISDIYRSASIEFDGHSDLYGVQLRRYGLREQDLLNATANPENAQFYQFGPTGVQNITTATGLPMVLSKPHFLDGAFSLYDSVNGMNPNREIHDTTLDVEPITGVLLRAHKRLQVANYIASYNIPQISLTILERGLIQAFINQNPNLNGTYQDKFEACVEAPAKWNISNGGLYMPYTWVDEHFSMSKSDSEDFKDEVYGTQDFADDLRFYSFFVAGILFFGALLMMFMRRIVMQEAGLDEDTLKGDEKPLLFSSTYEDLKDANP